jgi:hypothetical protein
MYIRNYKHNTNIAPADKGETIVIIHYDDYNHNIYLFLNTDNFYVLQKEPTNKYKQIQGLRQQKKNLTDKHKAKHLTQNNPSTPKLKAQLKIHNTIHQSAL